MNCKQCLDLATEIAFGEAERTNAFDSHLSACDGCRKEFEMYRFAAEGINDAAYVPPPSLSNERLRSAILAEGAPRQSGWLPRFAVAGGFAAIAFAYWFATGGLDSNQQPSRVVASNDVVTPIVPEAPPSAPIQEPIAQPDPEVGKPAAVVASAERPTYRRSINRRNHTRREAVSTSPQAEPAEELLAVVIGGAEGALDSDFSMEAATQPEVLAPGPAMRGGMGGGGGINQPAIVVIQPEGQATEKQSSDVSIGG